MLSQTYADEMPLSELRTPELLLLATLRIFAESAWSDVPRHWSEGLAAANVAADGIAGLAKLFGVIAVAPRRKLAVACRHCRTISPDEGRFLQLVGLLQRKNSDDARDVLLHWVTPTAARLALPHAQALADGLAQQGYVLPRRPAIADIFLGNITPPVSSYLH